MRISDWSSDVCSSDLRFEPRGQYDREHVDDCEPRREYTEISGREQPRDDQCTHKRDRLCNERAAQHRRGILPEGRRGEHSADRCPAPVRCRVARRSEEHTSELQSLMRISYAVFCLKKTTTIHHTRYYHII